MDLESYRKYLEGRKFPADLIARHLAVVEQYIAYCDQKQQSPNAENARQFIDLLEQEKQATLENLLALGRLGLHLDNKPLFLVAVALLDGSEVMGNLYERLACLHGEEMRDRIFKDIPLPSLAATNLLKAVLMQSVMERMESLLGGEAVEKVLSTSLRTLPDEGYLDERRKYREAGSLDAYLKQRREDYLAELTHLKESGKLYFDQPITDAVIEFVRSNPEVTTGVREGNIVYEVKIPYRAVEYLTEQDERMKRYYYCHCPWVRESIRAGNGQVPQRFCLCSAGYHKKTWEIIFEQPLKAEVLESVLKGDMRCRFAIHLPEEVND